MRRAKVVYKGEEAGTLTQEDDGSFVFSYLSEWIERENKPPISLTLPKVKQAYRSETLFPFFYNMLPEGENRDSICFQLRIDKDDFFSILLSVSAHDTIGAVTLESVEE